MLGRSRCTSSLGEVAVHVKQALFYLLAAVRCHGRDMPHRQRK
jgi:hypothetical protein